MKELLSRLAYKLSGHKALFAIAVMVSLWLHDFTSTNGNVLIALIIAVFGLKSVEKAGAIVKAVKGLRE